MFNRFSATSSPAAASNSPSYFGQQPQQQQQASITPAQSTSPFGNPFGAGSGGVGAAPASMSAPSTPYAITNELENGVTVKFLSISAMPAYRHLSQEEIRVDDYAKGRKGPSGFPGSKPGAFSQPFSTGAGAGGFQSGGSYSAASTPSTSYGGGFGSAGSAGGFGSSVGGFGSQTTAPAAAATPSPSFGAGAFGSGAFGSAGTSAFGSTPSTASGGFSGFGSSAAPTAPAPVSGFSGFGGSTAGTGAFGSTAGTGAFGSTGGTGGFGSAPTAPFGSTTPAATSNIFGGFGGGQAQPFGSAASSTGMFGAKPSTGMFGSSAPATPAAPSFSSSAFGASTPFGSQSTAQPQSGFTGGFGGGSAPQQPPQTQQFGMFGASTPAAAAAGPSSTGMFGSALGGFGGSTQQPFTSTATAGMFGQQPSAQPQPTQQSNLMFGSAPTASSASAFRPTTSFGGLSTIPSTSAAPLPFSGFAPASSSSTSSTGMFNRPATNTGAFGTSAPSGGFSFQPASASMSGIGLGGTPSFNQQQQAASTVAAAALPFVQPAQAGSLSLFPPLPSIFSRQPSESSQQPSSTSVHPSAPKSPVKFTPRTSFRIKPRDSYNLTAPIPINFGTGPISSSTGPSGASTNLVPRKMMTGSVPNIKKLVIPDFSDSTLAPPSTPSYHQTIPSTPATPAQQVTAATSSNILTDSMSFGQQYTYPPLKILKTTDRRSIKNFVIGQKGIGEVRFLVPVDLSDVDPELLFGHYIEFCEEEAVMYPDPSIPKPEPGHGLNQPAQVKLERIWTMSKGSRDPIVDPQNEKVIHFIQKLKETEGTNFISYDPSTGTWTFTVDNF